MAGSEVKGETTGISQKIVATRNTEDTPCNFGVYTRYPRNLSLFNASEPGAYSERLFLADGVKGGKEHNSYHDCSYLLLF